MGTGGLRLAGDGNNVISSALYCNNNWSTGLTYKGLGGVKAVVRV